MKTIFTFWIVIFCFQISSSAAQQFPALPKDTDLVIDISKPEKFADLLDQWVQEIHMKGQLEAILTSEPSPLVSEDQYSRCEQSINEFLETLRSTNRWLFVSRLNRKPEFYLRLTFTKEQSAEDFHKKISSTLSHIQLLGHKHKLGAESLNELKEGAEETSTTKTSNGRKRHFHSLLKTILAAVGSIDVTISGKHVIFANSPSLTEWIAKGDSNPKKSRLISDRRFKRTMLSLKSEKADGTIFLVPKKIMPYLGKKYNEKYSKRWGIKELTGLAAAIRIGEFNADSSGPLVDCWCSVPFTFPPNGIAKQWTCFRPIEKIPDIQFLNSLQKTAEPESLMITSVDRKKLISNHEIAYQKSGDLKAWKAHVEKIIQRLGSYELYRDYCNGTVVDFQLRETKPQPYRYRFLFQRHESTGAAKAYVKRVVEMDRKTNVTPRQLTKIADYDGWFLTDTEAIEEAKFQYETQVQPGDWHWIQNRGYVLTRNWMIYGRLEKLRPFLEEPTALRDLDPMSQLSKVIPECSRLLKDHPSWIQIKFRNTRLRRQLYDLRYQHFKSISKRKMARKLVKDLDPVGPAWKSLKIENKDDRLFAVVDFATYQLFNRFNQDVLSFSCKDNHLEFHWQFFHFDKNTARSNMK